MKKDFSWSVIPFLIKKIKKKIQPNFSKKSPFQVESWKGAFIPQKDLSKAATAKKEHKKTFITAVPKQLLG